MKTRVLRSLCAFLLSAAALVAQPTVTYYDQSSGGSETSYYIEFNELMNATTLNANTIKVYGSLTGAIPLTINVDSYDPGAGGGGESSPLRKGVAGGAPMRTASAYTYVVVGFNRAVLPGETLTFTMTTGIQNASNVNMVKSFIRTSTEAFTFSTWAYEAPSAIATEDQPNNVLVADVDLDGDVDIAVLHTGSEYVSIRRNNGDGTFAAAVNYSVGSGLFTRGGAFGDINGDGYPDLVVTNSNTTTPLTPILNDGDGTFTVGTNFAATASFFPDFVGFADLDGDGDLDLMLSSQFQYFGSDVAGRMFNNGSGVFSSLALWSVGAQPVSMAAADFDGDNDLDIAVANMNGNSITLLINNGSGGLSTIRTLSADVSSPRRIAFADLDDDGDLDMYVANHNGNNVLRFLNDGNAGSTAPFAFFPTAYATGASTFPQHIAFADADADGNTDMIVSGSDLFIFPGNGSGGFDALQTIDLDFSPYDMAVADFSGTKSVDFATVDLANDAVKVILNAVPPNVVSITPSNNALNVSPTSNIVVVFDRDMSGMTLNSATVRVQGSRSGWIEGILNYNAGTKSLTISSLDFMPGEVVTVSLLNQALSTSDAGLNPYVSSYTVAASGNGYFELAGTLNTGTDNNYLLYAADVDGDGDDDLIGFNGNILNVYKNTSGVYSAFSTFALGSEYPEGAHVGDFNKDGNVDIAAWSFNTTMSLFENDGTGVFTRNTTFNLGSSGQKKVVVADFDADGNLDLAYNIGNGILNFAYGAGDFTFPAWGFKELGLNGNYFYPQSLAAADFNNDGLVDVTGIDDSNNMVFVAINQGGRVNGQSFQITEAYALPDRPRTVAAANLFADGNADIVVSSVEGKSFSVLENNGDGTFQAAVTYGVPFELNRVTPFDFTGNGATDLVFYGEDVNGDPLLFMAYNDGTGGFGNQVTFSIPNEEPDWYYGFSLGYAVVDANNDGALDIASRLSNGMDNHIAFVLNAAPAGGGSAPTQAVTLASASSITDKSAQLSWTSGDGLRRLIVLKEGAPVDATLVDDSGYGPNPIFGQGSLLGTGNYFVYGGNGTSTTILGLSSETTYHYAIYEINGIPGEEKILTAGAPTGSFTTIAPPPVFRISEGSITFTKSNYADWTLEANQDRITDSVWITRQNDKGLFNIASETSFTGSWSNSPSPKGTLWAYGNADQIATMTFRPLMRAIYDDAGFSGTDDIIGETFVMYVEAENFYVEVQFTGWSVGSDNGGPGGGGFSYIRADGDFPVLPPIDFDTVAGQALSFDGNGNFAQFSTYNNETEEYYDFADPMTLEMWVKPSSLPGTGEFDLVMSSRSRTLYIGINEDHKFFTSIRPNPSDYFEAIGTTTVETNKWYHVSVSVEGNGELRLYVNAELEASTPVTTTFVMSTDWINLGGGYVYPSINYGHFFHGQMDEFRIWNSERSASQIRSEMFTAPISATMLNAALAWQMNEGTGTSVVDLINGFNLDLTSNGASTSPTWVTSTIPFGAETLSATGVQSGTANVGGATLTFNTPFENPVDVFFNEITTEPNLYPDGFTASLGGKYFVIDLVGDPGTFSLDLTLTFGSGVVTPELEASPSLLKLYRRNSGSGATWTEIASASSAIASTGVVTWPNITSFSEFMAVEAEPPAITEVESLDITAYSGSTYAFDSDLFEIDAFYGDETFTLTANLTAVGTLFVDTNDNGVYDAGTDDILTLESSAAYTPSDLEARLRYTPSTKGVETVIVTFTSGDVSSAVTLRFTTVEAYPSLAGVSGENGWYLLANPLNTPLGTLFENIWTQGAPNSDAPGGQATLFTFNQTTSAYEAVTTDLETTTLPAGTGILAYVYAFDNPTDGVPMGGGWPKQLTNEGNPFGLAASITVRNVDADEDEFTSGSEGFALLGNPFAWSLSADSVIATLKRADPLANSYVYRWNPVSKRYQLLTGGAINAYESVFVRLISSDIERTIDFDYQDGLNLTPAVKSVADESIMVPFTLTSVEHSLTSEMHVRIGKEGTAGIDPFDGYYLGSYASRFANLYMPSGDQGLVINNLPEALDREVSIPIHLHATVSGEFELSWNTEMLPNGWVFVLEETSTGTRVNLGQATSHRFTSERLSKSSSSLHGSVPETQGQEPMFILHIVPANVTSLEDGEAMPIAVELSQNYPNPFNPSTMIRYAVPSQSAVTLEVFDILGRQVATLVNNQVMPAGRHSVSFDAGRLASGVYVYRLVVGEKVMTKRMVLIK